MAAASSTAESYQQHGPLGVHSLLSTHRHCSSYTQTIVATQSSTTRGKAVGANARKAIAPARARHGAPCPCCNPLACRQHSQEEPQQHCLGKNTQHKATSLEGSSTGITSEESTGTALASSCHVSSNKCVVYQCSAATRCLRQLSAAVQQSKAKAITTRPWEASGNWASKAAIRLLQLHHPHSLTSTA